MKTGSILVLAGAGLAAWLLLFQKGQGESGTGGSLDIPALFGTGSIGGDPVPGVAPQPAAFQISDKILAAMNPQPKTASGVSWSYPAEIKSVQAASYGTGGVYASAPKKSGAVGLLPFGAGESYTPSRSISIGGGVSLGTNSPIGSTASGYHVVSAAKKATSGYTLTQGGYSTNAPKGVTVMTSRGRVTRY